MFNRQDAEHGMELILAHRIARTTVGSLVPGSIEIDAVYLRSHGRVVECYLYDVHFPRSARYPDIGPHTETRCAFKPLYIWEP